jgi:hypothetical protein
VFRRRRTPGRQADASSDELSIKIVGQLTEAEMATNGRKIHIDTALAGCAATAGALLLRNVIGDSHLAKLEPGSGLISPEIDEHGPRLLGLVAGYAKAAGIEYESSINHIPTENQPHEPHAILVQRITPAVSRVLASHHLPTALWPDYVAVSTVDLAVRAGDVFDHSLFANIVAKGLVAGSKTVPLR